VNALSVLSFNPVLTVGETTETVEVTSAPPVLDTSTATLGLVMENETYANLPLQMNNAQRDATAFGSLAPGAQGGPAFLSSAAPATTSASSIWMACLPKRSASRATTDESRSRVFSRRKNCVPPRIRHGLL
jgi:hypothetical protein